MAIAQSVAFAVAAGITSRIARRATRRAMHTQYGAPRLPVAARKTRGFGTALLWAAGTGAALALADVLREQQRETVRKERAASA
jgi:hypothetical protein